MPAQGPATSTQMMMAEGEDAKEVYYKSFETDSFDLEDCFEGSTQPQNSSLLSNRLQERTSTLPRPETYNQYVSGKLLPTAPMEVLMSSPPASSSELPLFTPVKIPSVPTPLNPARPRDSPRPAPLEDAIKDTIKNALKDLLANEPVR